MTDSNLIKKIYDMTQRSMGYVQTNVFKETLRQLVHIFGNIYFLDSNNSKTRIHCLTGKQERAIAKLKQENGLVLPYITVSENGFSENAKRRKNRVQLVNEVYWDEKEKKAKRILSLPSRAVDIKYQVNIWCKYHEDLDVIRSSILNLFNPDLNIDTKFSNFTKAFITDETDIAPATADDNADRVLKKTINITVETYIPCPKFLYTNTGEIKAFKAEVFLKEGVKEETILKPPEYLPEPETTPSGGNQASPILTLSGSLNDVTITSVDTGYGLIWNGDRWVASALTGIGGGVTDHQSLTSRDNPLAHPQYVLSSTNFSLSSAVSSHIASSDVHFTSGSLSSYYASIDWVNQNFASSSVSSQINYVSAYVSSVSSIVSSHINDSTIHFTSGSLSSAYVLTATNSVLSSLVDNHIGSAVHWELSTLNTNYLNASGDSANTGFYLSSVSATDISATNYYNLPSSTIVWKEAQDIVLLVHNKTPNTLFKGTPVTIVSGTGSGDTPNVEPLSSVNTHIPEAYGLSNHVAGLIQEDLPAGGIGHIIVEGILEGQGAGGGLLNTSIFAVGDMLYVSSNGQLSNQRPLPPYESHPVGIVLRSQPNNGKILVKIENSPELNDIVGFNLSQTILDGDLITYDLTTSTFVNKQTVTVSGLGRFGTVSATTVSAGTIHVGGSDGIIKNNNGDIIISATNGIIRFPYGLSAASVSTTTYTGLPSSTALWNANQLQGRNVSSNAPGLYQVLIYDGNGWVPSSITTGGTGTSDHAALINTDLPNAHPQYASSSVSAQIQSVSAYASGVSSIVSSHINDSTIHFTSGSLSGYYAASSWVNANYSPTSHNHTFSALSGLSDVLINSPTTGQSLVWSSTRWVPSSVGGGAGVTAHSQLTGLDANDHPQYASSSVSAQIQSVSAYASGVSSIVSSHINDSTIHFTSGSLSGYYAASSWAEDRYVLSSTNSNLSSLVSNIQVSANNISSVLGAHIASSDVHFTSGSLSGAYVLTSTNSNLSTTVSNLQASTASISSVVNSHINDSSIHFTSGSLSGYYAASSWTEDRYVLSSTNNNLSSLVLNIQTSSNNLSGVVGAHIASSDVHFTSGSLSGAYVLINTNQTLSSLVNNIQTSSNNLSGVVGAHIASGDVHFTSGSLSGYYAASSWVNANYSPTSHNHTFSALSGLSDTLITSPSQGQSLVWSSTRWVPSSVGGGGTGSTNPGGPDTSVQFNNSNSFSGVSEFTFNRSNNTLNVPTLSATTYQNLPSGAPVWNANSLSGYPIRYTLSGDFGLGPVELSDPPQEGSLLAYTNKNYGAYGVIPAWRPYDSGTFAGLNIFNANKIQGTSASPTAPTSNQILVYSGAATAWVPKNISEGSTASAFVFNNNGILSGTNDVFWNPSNKTLTTLKINNYEDIYSNYFNGPFGILGPTGLQANQVSATTYLNLPITYGTAAPNNGTGNEGDIYLQYS